MTAEGAQGMIKFYTNKQLAERFHINLSRWKRWSREFLPPDPLGGLQSGYARQYNPNEAFILYLAGHLVSGMKFSISEARQILSTLEPWLRQHGFLFNFSSTAQKDPQDGALFSAWQLVIVVRHQAAGTHEWLTCLARGMERSAGRQNFKGRRQCYVEFPIGAGKDEFQLEKVESFRVLNISVLHQKFLNALKAGKD